MSTDPTVAPNSARGSGCPPRDELPRRRVLVIGDSAPMRAIVRSMLSTDGSVRWEVTEASSGTEFLGVFGQQPPFDVVVLDMQTPAVSGFAACRALRAWDRRVPLLFVTADGTPGSCRQERRSGGDSYLVKPFSASGLKTALHCLIVEQRPEAR